MGRFFIVAVVAMAFIASPATAASQKDIRDCDYASDPDVVIVGCTRGLASGRLPRPAAAFNNRGLAWNHKRDFDRAISDLDEAIRLDPKSAAAYVNRGNAWSGKKEYDRAISDFTGAIRLDPKNSMAYNNRGAAWNDKGEPEREGSRLRACVAAKSILRYRNIPLYRNSDLSYVSPILILDKGRS